MAVHLAGHDRYFHGTAALQCSEHAGVLASQYNTLILRLLDNMTCVAVAFY